MSDDLYEIAMLQRKEINDAIAVLTHSEIPAQYIRNVVSQHSYLENKPSGKKEGDLVA